jgi:hypothetical protein
VDVETRLDSRNGTGFAEKLKHPGKTRPSLGRRKEVRGEEEKVQQCGMWLKGQAMQLSSQEQDQFRTLPRKEQK